jgi:hypothetical protein
MSGTGDALAYARRCISDQRAARIRTYRSLRNRGYTTAQAAVALGVSGRTAQRYEHEPAGMAP